VAARASRPGALGTRAAGPWHAQQNRGAALAPPQSPARALLLLLLLGQEAGKPLLLLLALVQVQETVVLQGRQELLLLHPSWPPQPGLLLPLLLAPCWLALQALLLLRWRLLLPQGLQRPCPSCCCPCRPRRLLLLLHAPSPPPAALSLSSVTAAFHPPLLSQLLLLLHLPCQQRLQALPAAPCHPCCPSACQLYRLL
jgi:hypothetical protein